MVTRFGLLGDVVAISDGRSISLGHARQRCVLAALLVDLNRVVSLDRLIDRVWGEHPPQRARDTLYGYLYRLRRAFADLTDVRIVRESGGYLISADAMAVDLHRFRQLVRQARAASTDEARLARYDQALELWRGKAFDGLDTDWLGTLRTSLEQERLEAALERADVALRVGRYDQVLTDLARLATDHPLNERLAEQAMRALQHSGRPAEALEYYHRFRTSLAEELGVDPSPRLQRLHRALLAPDAAMDSPRAAEPVPVPRQLPMQPQSFIGRSTEIKRLDVILNGAPAPSVDGSQTWPPSAPQPVGGRVVAIVGPGGIGKTWLALHWAHTNLDRFSDGQLFVNLCGFDPTERPVTAATALGGFLDALGVSPAAIPADLATRASLYRSLVAGRRMLIVLDNARDADQVRPLLPGSPTCAVLLTSRNQLSGLATTDDVHFLPLDVLGQPESQDLLSRRLGRQRVVAEPAAVRDIVAACGGLPLALSIVAVRAATRRFLSLRDLADELADRQHKLDALATSDIRADLRSVFATSYHALGAPAATLFRLLAICPGADVGTATAASLIGTSTRDLREPLDELIAAHLVGMVTVDRLACHDLLRQFATELLTETERAAATRRLLDHYLHTAHAAGLMIEPLRDAVEPPPAATGVTTVALANAKDAQLWLDTERLALLASVEQAVDAGLDGHAWRLASALSTYLSRSSRWSDLLEIQRIGVAAAERVGDLLGQAHCHRDLGVALHQIGLGGAMGHLHRAAHLFGQLTDLAGQAHTFLYLGWVCERQGNQRDALSWDERALAGFERIGDLPGQAKALNAVGWDHAQLGDQQTAISFCRRALALYELLGDPTGTAKALDSLGYAHHRLGDLAKARSWYGRALELYRQSADRYGEAETLAHLGDILDEAGDPEAARRSRLEALDCLTKDNPLEIARLRRKLGLPNDRATEPPPAWQA